jgi:hypothetical protein
MNNKILFGIFLALILIVTSIHFFGVHSLFGGGSFGGAGIGR